MNKNEVLDRLQGVFETFFAPLDEFSIDSTIETIEDWDSVAHIQLIFEIEGEFNIEFDSEDIAQMDSVAKIVDYILDKA